MSFAEQLVGHTLNQKWNVTERYHEADGHTPGHFSVGYIVESTDGVKAFMKVINLSKVFEQTQDITKDLQELTEAFNHERNLLHICRNKRMTRVIRILDSGQVNPERQDGASPSIPAPFIIFECAQGDIRHFHNDLAQLELLVALQHAHHVAVGLKQLHTAGIAHQDLKPSNVLVFQGSGCKIADIGRASHKSSPAAHDHLLFAGDRRYATPEAQYRYCDQEWSRRRVAGDLFQLGSLLTFLLTKVNLWAIMLTHMSPDQHPKKWGGSFSDALPILRDAFDRALLLVHDSLPEAIANDVTAIIKQLSDPDPAIRGEAEWRGSSQQYSLDRIVTKLSLLCRKVEVKMLKSNIDVKAAV